MSAPTIVKGKDGTVKIDGASYEGQITTFSLSIASDFADTTTMGNDWKVGETTLKSWSGSFTAKFDGSNAEQELLEDALLSGDDVSAVFGYGKISGNKTYSGNIKVTGFDSSPAVEGVIELNISFTGNGTLTPGTVA